MKSYAKEIENLPNPITCKPVYAGFYFDSDEGIRSTELT